KFLLLSLLVGAVLAQRRDRAFDDRRPSSNDQFNIPEQKVETTTPRVEIKRFVNQQNPDGSYTYGFEDVLPASNKFLSVEIAAKMFGVDLVACESLMACPTFQDFEMFSDEVECPGYSWSPPQRSAWDPPIDEDLSEEIEVAFSRASVRCAAGQAEDPLDFIRQDQDIAKKLLLSGGYDDDDGILPLFPYATETQVEPQDRQSHTHRSKTQALRVEMSAMDMVRSFSNFIQPSPTPDTDYHLNFFLAAEDGTFRLETRDQSGAVKGKYGFYDANNELKVVEYNAGSRVGFHPQGNLIDENGGVPPRPAPSQRESAADERDRQAQPQQSFQSTAGSRRLFPVGDPNVFRVETPVIPPGQRARSGEGFSEDGTYIPSIALEGFSEDADEDGFVDEVPVDGRLPERRRSRNRQPASEAFTQFAPEPPRSPPRPQAAPRFEAPRSQPTQFRQPEPSRAQAPSRQGFAITFGEGIDGIQQLPFGAPAPRRPAPRPSPLPELNFRPVQQEQFRPVQQEQDFRDFERGPAAPRFEERPRQQFQQFQPQASFQSQAQSPAIFTASGQPFSGGFAFNPTSARARSLESNRRVSARTGDTGALFRSDGPESISPSFAGVRSDRISPLALRGPL
ncbi:unnamed protein product, partial [Cyprideis torosa]